MKIKLSSEQVDLLLLIGAGYDPAIDYDDAMLLALEDAITNRITNEEINNGNVSELGIKLLSLHDFIVDTYDS